MLYFRYIDDMFMIQKRTHDTQVFLKKLIKQHPKVKFEVKEIPFLETKIYTDDNKNI